MVRDRSYLRFVVSVQSHTRYGSRDDGSVFEQYEDEHDTEEQCVVVLSGLTNRSLKGVCELHGTCVSRRLALMVYVFSFLLYLTSNSNSLNTGTVGNDTTKKLGDETPTCSVDIESWWIFKFRPYKHRLRSCSKLSAIDTVS